MNSQIAPRTIIEAFLPLDGDVSLAVIYDTANQLGVDDQPVRLALRRLIGSGDIEQRGRGRSGAIFLTDEGQRRMHRDRVGLNLAFEQDAGRAPWDGCWRLVAISAPESERAIRDSLRRDLLGLGAAPISTGLYASPHDLTGLLSSDAMPYLVTAVAEQLAIRGLTESKEIASSLWHAAPTLDAYGALAHAIEGDDDSLPALVRQLRLADALDRALRDDPLIPPELRDTPWPPTEVRRQWLIRWNDAASQAGTASIYEGWIIP
ncbi:PaaX family transcriptional regulator [Microbacterium sp. LWO13-1.2]|uniref:PaaX family transcriptional regulator n=1 Tax=Microbacterium sp. LWO13-1.2 TaxID=3135262 RepID=UPI003138620A